MIFCNTANVNLCIYLSLNPAVIYGILATIHEACSLFWGQEAAALQGCGGRGLQWSPRPPGLLIDAHRWLLLASLSFPPPSFSNVVRWFHTKVILNIPLILSNLWEILRKTTRRQNITNYLKWPAALIEKNQ